MKSKRVPENAILLTRDEAAVRLGMSYSEFRRRQKLGEFVPVQKGDKGELLFREADIIMATRIREKVRRDVQYTKAEAASVFAALEAGKNNIQCVIEFTMTPAAVDVLAQQYARMKGGLFLTGEMMEKINALPLDGPFPIEKASDLLTVLRMQTEITCLECKKEHRVYCKKCVIKAVRAIKAKPVKGEEEGPDADDVALA